MSEATQRVMHDDAFGVAILLYKNDPTWTNREAVARAAIAAMREPTEAMRKAGVKSDFLEWVSPPSAYATDIAVAWRAMIDAALKTDA